MGATKCNAWLSGLSCPCAHVSMRVRPLCSCLYEYLGVHIYACLCGALRAPKEHREGVAASRERRRKIAQPLHLYCVSRSSCLACQAFKHLIRSNAAFSAGHYSNP